MKPMLHREPTALLPRDSRAITEQELAPALEAALRERLEDSVRQVAATRPRWPKGRGI